jgi:hypothetical protein
MGGGEGGCNVKEKFGARRNETRKPKDKVVMEGDWAYFTV